MDIGSRIGGPSRAAGVVTCHHPGCPARVVWPCSYLDQDGIPCAGSWCLEHVEFVSQARYCRQHAELIASRLGRCSHPGCEEREVWVCNYRAGAQAGCRRSLCRQHIAFMGVVPFCPSHAEPVVPVQARNQPRDPVALGDRCRSLAELVLAELEAEIMDLLRDRFGERPGVMFSADEELREVWYQQCPVWWRAWGAFTQAGYLAKVAAWMPMAECAADVSLGLLVDGSLVLQQALRWGARMEAGEPPAERDLVDLRRAALVAICGAFDRPAFSVAVPDPEAGKEEAEVPSPPQPGLRVVVGAEDSSMVDDVIKLLATDFSMDISGCPLDAEGIAATAAERHPDVVLLGFTSDRIDAATVVKQTRALLPATPILLMAENQSSDVLLRARAAGARGLLVWPFEPDTLMTSIRVAAGLAAPEPIATAAALVIEVITPEVSGERSAGLVTAILSGQGGVGKSLVAMNLGAALAQAEAEEVGLIDLDLQFGDLALLLGVRPTTSIADVAGADLDSGLLDRLMLEAAAGLRVLPAAARPELADLVTVQHVRGLLASLRTLFSHSVVDCGSHLDDRVLEVVGSADSLVLVTDLTLSGIKNAKLMLGVMDKLQVPAHRTFVVVNRADAQTMIAPSEVARLIGRPVSVQLPTLPDRAVAAATEQGVPLYRLTPRLELAERFDELATLMGYRQSERSLVLSRSSAS